MRRRVIAVSTVMTLILGVLMTGCGDAVGETTKTIDSKKENSVAYKETVLDYSKEAEQKSSGDYANMSWLISVIMNQQGEVETLSQDRQYKQQREEKASENEQESKIKYTLHKQMDTDKWEQSEMPWSTAAEKINQKSYISQLFRKSVIKKTYSMMVEVKTSKVKREKKDKNSRIKKADFCFVYRLYEMNDDNGDLKELTLDGYPKKIEIKYRKNDKNSESTLNNADNAIVCVSDVGTIAIKDEHSDTCVYDIASGKKMCTINKTFVNACMDDYYLYVYESGKVQCYDVSSGKLDRSIAIEKQGDDVQQSQGEQLPEYDAKVIAQPCMSPNGTLYVVSHKGVYRLNDKENGFDKLADATKFYYMSLEDKRMRFVSVNDNGEFVIQYQSDYSSNKEYSNDDIMCVYKTK